MVLQNVVYAKTHDTTAKRWFPQGIAWDRAQGDSGQKKVQPATP